jgi:hypothetical protein
LSAEEENGGEMAVAIEQNEFRKSSRSKKIILFENMTRGRRQQFAS